MNEKKLLAFIGFWGALIASMICEKDLPMYGFVGISFIYLMIFMFSENKK